MQDTLEFPYKPRWGAALRVVIFFLVCVVVMVDTALNNDQGLVIDGFISLNKESATVFYWLVVAASLWPLTVGINGLRLSQTKGRCISLSAIDVTVPGVMPGEPISVVSLNDITELTIVKRRYARVLVIRHGTNKTSIVQGHFSDQASFERFLSHLQVATQALQAPPSNAQPSSAHCSDPLQQDDTKAAHEGVLEKRAERIDDRAHYVQKIRASGLLDAAFLLSYYNHYLCNSGPDRGDTIDVSEVLVRGLNQPDLEHAVTLADKMSKAAEEVALAYYKYPQARYTFEQAISILKTDNPGFNEESYRRAVNVAYTKLR